MTLAVNIAQGGSNNVTFRNRIINGNMVISQRGTSFSAPANGDYTLDRWQYISSQSGKVAITQDTSVYPVGFTSSLKATSSSAYSVGASEKFTIRQCIEGVNVADLAWGTANAKTVTLSAWVYSSLTGTFGGSIYNYGANYFYPFSYTISSANTWTQISVTIAGPTAGTWDTGTVGGTEVSFSLGAGTTVSGTAGTWGSTAYFSATGATSVVGTSGATFYITGVQLEAGTTASPFEYRQYTTELSLCQRYYMQFGVTSAYEHYGIGVAQSNTSVTIMNLPVTMRTAPTFGYLGSLSGYIVLDGSSAYTPSVIAADVMSLNVCSLAITITGVPVGRATRFYRNASSLATLTYSAEL